MQNDPGCEAFHFPVKLPCLMTVLEGIQIHSWLQIMLLLKDITRR